MINRELIFTAFYALIKTVPGIVTFSRELAHIDDVAPEQMPYLCMVCQKQQLEQSKRTPPKYTLPVALYLYVQKESDDIPAQVLMNNYLDAIDAVMQPFQAFPPQTLEGVANVEHVRIQGVIETDEGTLGARAVAVVPVEIIAVG